jgi:hypothetical protein
MGSGFGQPIPHPEALAYLAALAPGLLGLRRSRGNGAERMLVGTHGINHVTYFHQDYVSFRFGFASVYPLSLNDANRFCGERV